MSLRRSLAVRPPLRLLIGGFHLIGRISSNLLLADGRAVDGEDEHGTARFSGGLTHCRTGAG